MTEGVLSRISRVASSSLPNAALVNDAPCERVGKRRVPFRTWVEMYRPSVIDPSKEDPT